MQLNFDFSRAEQLATLRHAQLPAATSSDGKRIEPRAMLAMLRCLDDHAGGKLCWVSFETLARETGYSVRSCKRGIAALESLSLVCVETKCIPGTKTRVNHYRIVWSELLLLRRDKAEEASGELGVGSGEWAERKRDGHAAPQPLRPPDQSALGTDQSALGTDQSALGTDQSALGTDQSAPRGTLSALEAPMKRSYGRADGILNLELGIAKSAMIPQPPAPSPQPLWSPAEREQIDRELAAIGYERRGAFGREFAGVAAAEVLAVLAEYRGNRRLFSKAGPGVIPGRLRDGEWKVAGVKTAAEIAAQPKPTEPSADVVKERQVWELSRRRRKISQEVGYRSSQYFARCAAELPAWFVEAYVT